MNYTMLVEARLPTFVVLISIQVAFIMVWSRVWCVRAEEIARRCETKLRRFRRARAARTAFVPR